MKFARITHRVAFGILILASTVGTASAAGSAVHTKTKTGTAKSSTSSSSSTASAGSQSNAAGVQIYTAANALQIGTVIQLAGKSSNTVEPATYKNMQQMYGVTVDPNKLPLTITDANVKNQTYVATDGTYSVLVDTQNGTIKDGDYLTMSAVDGVAMKAGTYDQQATVLGRAVNGFDGKANVIGTTALKNTAGASEGTAQIGVVSVSINIQRNPNDKSTKTNLPPFLQRVGQEIAQRNVSPFRIYLAITVTGLCIIVALVTLYAGIRNAMIAIGRNPLSKKSIFRGLFEIVLTSFLILIIGLFAVYLLLKL